MSNKSNNDTTMIKFVKSIDKFWNTNIAFVFFTIIVLLVGALQISLFLTGHPISGVLISEDDAWVGWAYLVISLPAVLSGCYAEIYTIRVNKNFFVFAMISDFITMISVALGGMMWTSLMLIAAIVITIYRYHLINKYGKDYEINKKLCTNISFTLFAIFLVTGITLINVLPEGVFWWNPESTMITKYIDVISSTFIFLGVTFILTKNKHAFSIFMLCDLSFIIAFSLVSQWLTVLQTSLYSIINVLGYFAWSFKEKHPEIWDNQKITD